MSIVTYIKDKLGVKHEIGAKWDNVSGKPSTFAPSAHNHNASDINAGTLPIARGGTGATSAEKAQVNLIPKKETALGAASDTVRIPIFNSSGFDTNGVIAGYRTALQLADYMNGKIKKLVPFWVTGGTVTSSNSWFRAARIPVGSAQRDYGGVKRRWAQWAQLRLTLLVEGRYIGCGEINIAADTSGSVDVPEGEENEMAYALPRLAQARISCTGTANRDYIQVKFCFNEEQYSSGAGAVAMYADVWLRQDEYNTTSIFELGKSSTSISLFGWSSDCIKTTPTSPDWTYYEANTYYKCSYGVTSINTGLMPDSNNTRPIGTSTLQWATAYIKQMYGNLTGNVTGNVTGDVTGSSSRISPIVEASAAYVSNDTHYARLGWFAYSGDWSNRLIGIGHSFYGQQHYSFELVAISYDAQSGSLVMRASSVRMLRTGIRLFYCVDTTQKRIYLYAYITGGNGYGKVFITPFNGGFTSDYALNQDVSDLTLVEITELEPSNAKKALALCRNHTARQSSINLAHESGGIGNALTRVDQVTSAISAANGKPGGDGFVITMNWDSTAPYDTQIYFPCATKEHSGMPQIRFKDNKSEWGAWGELNIGGNAATATNATNDSDGKKINDTYRKKNAITIATSTDLNTLTTDTTGGIAWYICKSAGTASTLTNKPSSVNNEFLLEVRHTNNPDYVSQRIYSAVNGDWYRKCSGGKWSEWKQMYSTATDTLSGTSSQPISSKAVKSALDAKQDTLTFDTTPTESSSNPVTSAGVKSYVDSAVTGLYKYRGSVNTDYINALQNPSNGDVYNINASGTITNGEGGQPMSVLAGDNVAFVLDPITSTTYWDKMSSELDLSNFVDFDDIATATTAGVVKSSSTNGKVSVDASGVMTVNGWNGKQNVLTQGTNITISGNTISATDTTYSEPTDTVLQDIVDALT